MAITRLATYSINQGLQKSETFLAGQENIGWYEAIASYTFASDAQSSNLSFTNIPQYYSHLQLRIMHRDYWANTWGDLVLYLNSDTSLNYTYHQINASGSGIAAGGATSWTGSLIARDSINAQTSETSVFSTIITDILDYSNTNKYKTVRSFSGYNSNSTSVGRMAFVSSAWLSTAAISTIVVKPEAGFKQYSQIALYGIRTV